MRDVLVGRRSDQSSPVIGRSAFSGPKDPGTLCHDASCERICYHYQIPFAGESINVNGATLLLQGSF